MPSIRFLIRCLGVLGAILAVGAILLAVGRFMLATPVGMNFVEEQLTGRKVGPGWTVEASGLSGDVLSELHIERLQLSDTGGVWFSAEDIEIDWNPFALLTSRTLDVRRVRVDRAALSRRPAVDSGSSSATGAAMSILVGALDIRTIELDAAVSGAPAAIQMSAALSAGQAGMDMRLAAATIDGGGDRLTAELTWPRGGVPSGLVEVFAPAGSAISGLLALPESDIFARLSLPTGNGPGEIRLDINDHKLASGLVDRMNNALTAELRVDPRPYLRHLPDIAELAGSQPIRVGLVYGSDRVLRADATADRWSGQIVARSSADWTVDGQVEPEILHAWVSGLDPAGPVRIRTATGVDAGVYEIALETDGIRLGPTVTGDVGITASVRRDAAGVLDLAIEGEIADVEDSRLLQAVTLQLTASGQIEPRTRRIVLEAMTLSSEVADANASLTWSSETGLADLVGTLAVHDIEALAPQVSGPARVTISQSEAGGFDVTADLARLNWPAPAQDMTEELSLAGNIRSDDGGWLVRSVEINSRRITARAARDETSPSRHNLRGQASLVSAPLPGGLSLDGALSADFVVGLADTGLDIQLLAGARQITAGAVIVAQPRLALEGTFDGGRLDGQLRASGDAGGRAVTAAGVLRAENADIRLDALIGQFGDLQFAGSASSTASGVELHGQTRSRQWSAEIEARLPAGTGSEPTIAAHARGESVQFGSVTLNAFEVSASGPVSSLSIEANATGLAHRPFQASVRGLAGQSPTGLELVLSGEGDWAGFPVIMRDLSISRDSADASLRAGLDGSLDAANVTATYESTGARGAVVSADASGLPAQLIAEIFGTQPVLGEAGLNGRFVLSDDLWTGQASLVASGLRKPEYVEFPGMRLALELRLAEHASLTGRLAANALEVALDVSAPNTADLLARLGSGDVPTETVGSLTLDGNLDALDWAMPADIDVAGQAHGRITVTMPNGRPSATGSFDLDDGRLVLADAGTRLDAMSLSLVLEGPQWRISRGSASDGAAGRLSLEGDGRFDAPEGAAFEITGEFSDFRWLNRDDARIVASGDWAFARSGEQDRLSGSARILDAWFRPSSNGPASVARMRVEEINLPDNRAHGSRSRRPALLDYRVTADRTIEAGTRFFNSRWSTDIHVGGNTRQPLPTGSLRLSEGNILIFNRRFQMESGEAVLAERLEDSRFDVRAVHRGNDLDTYLRLHGPLDAPILELTSSPDLPQDEIVSRLLFGRSAGQLGPLEAAELAAQLSGRSSLNLVGRLREIAQLDRLQVETGGDALRVAAGRDFGERVSVDVEHAGAGLFDSVSLSWAVTRDIEFLSRVTGDTNGSVALVWSREY